MGNPWDGEVDVTPGLVRELLAGQFPALPVEDLRPYGEGWDNVAYLLNGRWVFRFPKREAARKPMVHEIRYLPALADGLPLQVPRLDFVGQPQGPYPFPFCGYEELAGRTACSVDWTHSDRIALGPQLGAFLARLHREDHPCVGAPGFPGDQIRRTDLPYRLRGFEERIASLESTPGWPSRERWLERARDLARTAPWSGTPRVVHGDLYARHLLVDPRRGLCGVIDWGDVHQGDPALDLSILYGFLPAEARPGFLEAYGPVDPGTLRRARFRALVVGALLISYAREIGDGRLAVAGQFALLHALEP